MMLNAHGGIRTGVLLAPTSLPCDGVGSREIGERGHSQLITFTTAGDCSSCAPHLAGLDSLIRREALPVSHLFVVYSRKATTASDRRTLRGILNGVICWDHDGALWDRHDISHTPVTVLSVNGRVLLVHDAPLVAPHDRARLVDSVKALVRDH